jgi:biotin carboxylase
MAHLVFVETTRPGLQAIEAAKRLGHRVTLITSGKFDWLLTDSERAKLQESVDTIWSASDTQNSDAVYSALVACHKSFLIDAVLSTLHQCAAPAAAAAARLGLRATSITGIQNARNKVRCRELIAAADLPSVKYAQASSIDEAVRVLQTIGYPAIIKPATGMGKVLTRIVHDASELLEHFEHAAAQFGELQAGLRDEISLEFIIEELAIGPLYSIEVGASAHGECIPLTILRRKTGRQNPVLEMGSTIPCGLSDAEYDTAASYAIKVVQALGLDLGIFHVEFIYTHKGPRLVEVNPRIAGGSIPDLICTASGYNLFELLVQIYLGERIGVGRLPTRTAASHSFIGADSDCVVRTDLPDDWFAPIRQRLHSGYSDIRAGHQLRKMDGNYDLYGVLRVTADNCMQAAQDVAALHHAVEQVLGVKLVEIDD